MIPSRILSDSLYGVNSDILDETAADERSHLPGFKNQIKYKVNRATFDREAALLAEVFGDDIKIHYDRSPASEKEQMSNSFK
jgi:hypothetical protein